MSATKYPDEPAGPFPAPPRTITDREGNRIELELVDPDDRSTREALVTMYERFDPADRAQGIPPLGETAIREWIDLIVAEGTDVVAWADGEIVGHVTLVPENDDGEHELAIFVLQEHQEKGIGTELLRTALGAAAAAGVEYVWLTVERWNDVAIRVYESTGFEPTGAGNFELEMTMRLTPVDRCTAT